MSKTEIKEKIFEFAKCLVKYSGGDLELVKNQEDDSTDENKEAANFLKLNGKRLGRDLELYAFMAELSSEQNMLCDLLMEILIPTRHLTLTYREGTVILKNWGDVIFDTKKAIEWAGLF